MEKDKYEDPVSDGAFWENRWKTGDTPWDHGRAAPPFAEFVEKEGPPSGRMLIPGCGSGHDVRFFAQFELEVLGLDISDLAVVAARQYGSFPNISFLVGDILNPPPALLGAFDWVAEHTCLCAMEPELRPRYARAIPRILRPGGHFLAIFYRDPEDNEGPPHGITADEIDALFGPSFALKSAWRPEQSYASRVGLEEVRWYQLL